MKQKKVPDAENLKFQGWIRRLPKYERDLGRLRKTEGKTAKTF